MSTRMILRTVLVSSAIVALPALAEAKRTPEAVFPAREGTSRLVFECGEGKAVWLRVRNPQRGWLADKASEVRLGQRGFRTEIDGASDSFILSDVPLPGMGVTATLLDAAKNAEELVLAGPAAEQIPGPRRSFPLAGARAKIEAVEKACGGKAR
jgi:hypothetical protein